jgi:hypothetical protein
MAASDIRPRQHEHQPEDLDIRELKPRITVFGVGAPAAMPSTT